MARFRDARAAFVAKPRHSRYDHRNRPTTSTKTHARTAIARAQHAGTVARAMLGLTGLLLGVAILFGSADEHVLQLPYRSQLDGSPYAGANCGPTSLSMMLAYYGIEASPWELRVKSMKAQH